MGAKDRASPAPRPQARRRGHEPRQRRRAMAQLIEELFKQHLDNDLLRQGNDQAMFTRHRVAW